jgi:nucleoside phosphorylase/CheY-like chemotaxis protein
MLNILIVEDDPHRRLQTIAVISESTSGIARNVVEADSIVTAKAALSQQVFDVLLLDLALPTRNPGPILPEGGLQVLAAIEETEVYYPPTNIVAITGHETLHAQSLETLSSSGVGLLKYEPNSFTWKRQLIEMMGRFAAAKYSSLNENRTYGHDIALVCALATPELSSILDLPWNWRTHPIEYDSSAYHEGTIPREAGREWRIIAAAAPRMGMPASAALAAKMIRQFQPRYITMVGICAGNHDKTRIGDILVADPSWDAGSGKWVLRKGKVEFRQAPHQLPLANSVREAVRQLARNGARLSEIRNRWRADKPAEELRVLLGPLASTSAVIADGVSMSAIALQHKDLLGLEMEAYGVFAAAEIAQGPSPAAFVVKTVVDYGDPDKGEKMREYAAYAASEVFRSLAERYLGLSAMPTPS